MEASNIEERKWIDPPERRATSPVAERVAALVGAASLEAALLEKAVEELEKELGRHVYSELIFLMAHLWFHPDEAFEHWSRIIELRLEMEDFLGEPVDTRVALVRYFVNVTRKIRSPKVLELELFRRTEASVYRDELTGLHNFRYLSEHLAREIDLCRRHHSVVSVVMIDVDDFKHYNDRNGHLAGNDVLVSVARVLRDCIRESDVAVRYGGEEFTLVLSATAKAGGLDVAERARARIVEHVFPHGDAQPGGHLTISAGVATYPADATDATDLLRKADSAMYLAKSRGKNRVCGYDESRRSYQRHNRDLEGWFCELSGEYRRCRTLNVSEGGLLLKVDRELSVGALLDVRLMLGDEEDRPLSCSGRVVRVEESEPEAYRAAVCIGEMSSFDRHRLGVHLEPQLARSSVSAQS